MTTEPGRDYRLGETYQPDEPPLQMTIEQVRDLRTQLDAIAVEPGESPWGDVRAHPLRDVIVYRM
jgi:hypothetical protein